LDPDTGTHTQNIESYWAKTKYKFKVMKGVSADALPSYLDERMCNHIPVQLKKKNFYSTLCYPFVPVFIDICLQY
jgi:hypothetical protein